LQPAAQLSTIHFSKASFACLSVAYFHDAAFREKPPRQRPVRAPLYLYQGGAIRRAPHTPSGVARGVFAKLRVNRGLGQHFWRRPLTGRRLPAYSLPCLPSTPAQASTSWRSSELVSSSDALRLRGCDGSRLPRVSRCPPAAPFLHVGNRWILGSFPTHVPE